MIRRARCRPVFEDGGNPRQRVRLFDRLRLGQLFCNGGAPNRQALEQTQLIEKRCIHHRHHAEFVIRPELLFEDVGNVDRSQRRQLT